MIISMSIHGLMLAAGATLLLAPQGTCACGPLTLPSPPPRRPWMGHEAQGAGERGEYAQRPAHLPTSGPTTTLLTALLTHFLIDLLTHSLSTLSNCAEASRARRNLHPSISLRRDSPKWSQQTSWGLRLASRLGVALETSRRRPAALGRSPSEVASYEAS